MLTLTYVNNNEVHTMNVKYIEEGINQPTLTEAQEFVGGYVERSVLPNGDLALVDEEGLLKRLPVNETIATKYGVILVGNAIVIKSEARMQNTCEGWG